MNRKPLPAPYDLVKIFEYDHDTGSLTWLPRDGQTMFNGKYANRPALDCPHADGYRHGKIGGTVVLAHRVIWALVHGEWPATDIDHINGDRSDNRLSNLRLATRSQNCANAKKRSGCSSQFKGVRYQPKGQKWEARTIAHRKYLHLGSFDREEDAARAYDAAARKAFGAFAKPNFPLPT